MELQNNIFLDKKLNQFYYKNDSNSLTFNVVDNTILAEMIKVENGMDYDEVFIFVNYFFETMIREYPNIDNMINYPGTFNPLIAKVILDNVKKYSFDYCIFYEKEKIYDLENFETNILNPNCSATNGFSCSMEGLNVFKECSICSSLKPNTTVKSPIKYYRIDSEGYFVEELDEKPVSTTDNFYSAVRLSERFKKYNIKITDNGKLRFYKK